MRREVVLVFCVGKEDFYSEGEFAGVGGRV